MLGKAFDGLGVPNPGDCVGREDVPGWLEPMGVIEGAAADAKVVWKALEGQTHLHGTIPTEVQAEDSSVLPSMVVCARLADSE
jgi:hypothetical protein